MKRRKGMNAKKTLGIAVAAAFLVSSFYIPGNVVKTKASGYGLSNPTIKKDVVISGDDSEKEEGVINNPLVKATVTTWDCVYFGNYWQNDTNGDGTVDQNDEKQPIKWRVLSVDGDDAFLLADQNLDCQPYNEEDVSVTWETCTLRNWLNSSFLNNAFSAEEQSAIKNTIVVNEDNPYDGAEGGKDTTDKVYLLSIAEVSNTAYGFDREFEKVSKTREAKNTAYAKKCDWWLRSPGNGNYYAVPVNSDGSGGWYGCFIGLDSAVRPALHLNLSSSSWKVAEKVTAEEVSSSTWDSISFGNYWQSDTNSDGTVDQNDEKQPIKWRVLAVDGDDAFLLADQSLDCQPYNEEDMFVTWETCTLRKWLNSTFLTNAFSAVEQSVIENTTVVNDNNPYDGAEGDRDTIDKVYLLSIAEVSHAVYGFDSRYNVFSKTREAKNTAYATECGAGAGTSESEYEGNGNWWLRSRGIMSDGVALVTYFGFVDITGYSGDVDSDYNYNENDAVRPALHLNLSSSVWKAAGKVTVEEEDSSSDAEPTPTAIPTEIVKPTVKPTPTPTMPQAGIPTQKPSPTVSPLPDHTPSSSPTVSPLPDYTPSPSATPSGTEVKKAVIKSVKNKKGKKAIIRWKKVKGASGYQIAYAVNKKFKKKKTKNVTKTTVTLKKLKKKKTYYIKVRAYKKVKGKKVYGKWSNVKKVKIKK